MTLFEEWLSKAYTKQAETNKKFWKEYMPKEKEIYTDIIENKRNRIEGTVTELAEQNGVKAFMYCGFIDGINEALEVSLDMENLKEDTFVTLNFQFETLYKKMVEYKAKHLYNLPAWDNIFTKEQQQEFYKTQIKSNTVVKDEKIGRNDACPCGSGKKYKKCCGLG